MTKLQRLIRRPAPERGFTLIELLVVIIILGILAAVVVFAVSGVGDKGKSSAVKIDERTLRTAEEAYCAKNGQYGSGQELVAGGFLSDSPEYHNVAAQRTGFGQCNGWTYSIVETQASSGVAAGTWAAAPSPPGGAGGGTYDAIRLPSGKVATLGFDTDFNFITSLWDPTTNTWTQRDTGPFSAGLSFNTHYNQQLVLTQNCGANCGRILIRTMGSPSWHLFNPGAASGSQWTDVPNETSGGGENIQTLTELRDNPFTAGVECGSNCGKVLITNGAAVGGPVDLYDPNNGPTGSFTSVSNSDPAVNLANLSSLLPDGRVLLVGSTFDGSSFVPIARFFDPISLGFSSAPLPSLNLMGGGFTGAPASPVMSNGDILFGGAADNSNAPAAREVYTPQYGQDGSWTGVVPVCGPSGAYCQVLGALSDGKVLAYAGASGDRFSAATNPGETYVLDPITKTWSRSGDFDPGAAGDGELLDPRTGPCGTYCNKMLMVGQMFNGGAYNAAFFAP